MKQNLQTSRGARIIPAIILLVMVIMGLTSAAAASQKIAEEPKDSSAGMQPSGDLLSTWKTEAKGVAVELGLSKDQRSKLTAVFIAARKSQREAVRALPEEADRVKSRAAIEAVNAKERTALEKELKGILSDEQAMKALPLLGSFNHRWDTLVKALSELNLDKEKMNASMKLVGAFVTEYDKARREATASGSRFSSSVTRDLKEKLDAGLVPLLTAEQVKAWKEATKGGKESTASAKEPKKGGKAKATE